MLETFTQSGRQLRVLRQVFVAALLLLPAACAADDDPLPTVTYDYGTVEGARQVALQADERCDDLNGGDAWLLDSDPEPGGYRVVFVCRSSVERRVRP